MLNALRTDNSPFSEQQIFALRQGLGLLDRAQTAWLSGYLAGKLAGEQGVLPPVALPTPGQSELKVFYASQTGNGEALAEAVSQQAVQAGLSASAQSLNDLRPRALTKVKQAAFIISTHGEADPPDDALDLFEFLASPRAPRLESLKFRVLALGGSTYSQFCEAGRNLEELLLACGAQVFAQGVDCDLDYEEAAGQWPSEVVAYGRETMLPQAEPTALTPVPASLNIVPITSQWNRKHPLSATVEKIQKITAEGSQQEVSHIELSIENPGLDRDLVTSRPGEGRTGRLKPQLKRMLPDAIDWSAIAGPGRTTVVYMGVGQAHTIREKLIDAGISEHLPTVLITDGTRDSQQQIEGTVGSLPSMARKAALNAPGLLIIGQVAGLGGNLAWFRQNSHFRKAA